MIQKIKLIELVKHRLEGEAETKNLGKFHPVVIEYNIGQVYNTLLVQVLQQGLSNIDPYTKEYKDVSISQDADTDMYYSTLPDQIVLIPRRAGNGIVSIRPMNNDGNVEYVPITDGTLRIIEGLEVDLIDDVVGYSFTNGRIEYKGMTESIAADNVRIKLVIPFESYAETDYVQIPTGSNDTLISMVLNKMLGTPDSDNLNNNNTFNVNTRR